MKYEVLISGRNHSVEIQREAAGWNISVDGARIESDAVEVAPNVFSILIGGQSYEIYVHRLHDGRIKLQSGHQEWIAEVQDPRAWRGRRHGTAEAEGRQQIVAPMPGKVIRILVEPGDEVEAGQGLLVVEAMKMQNEIKSPKRGKVERLLAKEGQTVNAGDALAWID